MMAGNPNFWSMNGMHTQSHQLSDSQFVYGSNYSNSSSVTSDSTASADHPSTQDFPVRSWSQLLLGGLASGEEERYGASLFQQQNKLENWEDQQVLNLNSISKFARIDPIVDLKQEAARLSGSSSQLIYHNNNNNINHEDNQFHHHANRYWPHHHHHQVMPVVSSPTSCVTTLSNNFLNFSGKMVPLEGKIHRHSQEHSSECNSTSSGGVCKKARVQQSSAQPALKVRKEKLGDRITALHQLVSPFGKTDTASVLSEAIGYIRFLQSQIEALSSPYIHKASVDSSHHHHSVQERNCLYPEEAPCQDSESRRVKDLTSRGLCLVPIACTETVGNDNGADYWAPAAFGGGF